MGKHPGGDKGNSCDAFRVEPKGSDVTLTSIEDWKVARFIGNRVSVQEQWLVSPSPKLVRNSELTLAGPLTKLPTLLELPPSEGTSRCCNGLMFSPQCSLRSNGGHNRRHCNTISDENFAKKCWR
jgi:hypothetical protein